MIKSLAILNFQSHAKSKLDFHDGVNVIVGSSDAGKSAVIRALRWLSRNRPSGDSIKSNWGGATNVILETDEGFVRRVKDKKDMYELLCKEGRNLTFQAFGTDVPEEISSFLNLNEINLQYQLDRPFLLSDSPGEVAVHFNKIARLDKIDTGLSNVNSAIRKLEQDINYQNTGVLNNNEKLKEFEYLDKMEADVEVAEQMENQLRSKKSSLDTLQLKLYDYSENERYMESYITLLSDEQRVNTVLELWTKKDLQEVLLSKLEKLLNNIRNTQDSIEHAQEWVKDESRVNTLIQLYNSKKIAVEGLNTLSKLLSQYNSISNALIVDNASIKGLEAKFKKEMGDTCILCGQKIK